MKILVIDDDDDNRLAIALIFEEYGHELTELRDGKRAKETLQANSYDVLLLDLRMPEINGVAVLRACHEHLKNTFVIVLTAEPHMADSNEVEQYADVVLQKPYNMKMLTQLVTRFDEARRAKL